MLTKALLETHPTYDPVLWGKYDALYRGGDAFRQCIDQFLPKNPDEPDPVYQARRNEAHYCGYVGPIVDWFAARLLSAPLVIRAKDRGRLEATGPDAPDLAADSWYAQWKEDVDGVGTDLVDFLRARFTSACIKGRAWWLVEQPDDGGSPATTRADWEERGLGEACLVALENEQVLDWETDARGELEWAVVHTYEQRRGNVATTRSRVREMWRLYDRDAVSTWAVEYDPALGEKRPDEAVAGGTRPHGFRRVPLVRLGFVGTRGVRAKVGMRAIRVASSALEGFWLMQRLADPQIAHFRTSAAMDWNIKRTCYAMPVFRLKGDDQGEPKPPRMGAGYYIMIGEGEEADWIAPPTGHLSIVADRIGALKDEIYRVGNQMVQGVDNNAAAVGRSGESKRADAASTQVVLCVYGALCREAAERTYDLLSEARGDADKLVWSVEGLDTYDDAKDADGIAEAAETARDLDLPSPTFHRELAYRLADALLPGAEQGTRDTIRREIDAAMAEKAAKASAGDTRSADGNSPDCDEDDVDELHMDHRDDARRIALPPAMLAKLHVRQLGTLGKWTVWAVDGNAVRLFDTDFTDAGNPSRYTYVPANELWVEQRIAEAPQDLAASLVHEAVEAEVMADGAVDYELAHCAARAMERVLRNAFASGGAAAATVPAALAVASEWLPLLTKAAKGLAAAHAKPTAATHDAGADEPPPSSRREVPGHPDPDSQRPDSQRPGSPRAASRAPQGATAGNAGRPSARGR